jgi:hypothetical protein
VLNYRANRWANITAGTFMTAVQSLTLFLGVPAPYYLYLSIIEITCTVLIVGYAWKWREAAVQPADQPEVATPPAATAASR